MSMKAIECSAYGGPDVLTMRELAIPTPKDNEVLIKIKAAGVNTADVRIRGLAVDGFMRIVMRLVLGLRKPRNAVLGTTLSGIVESVGRKVIRFKPGDQIFGTTGLGLGAYAEYICLPESGNILQKPPSSSFEQAVAILFGGLTSIYFLRKAGIESKSEQKVLIYGATGSVGTAAVQVAKHYRANVTSICGEQGVELAKSLGSDNIIVYTRQDITSLHEQFDIIFDAVGKIKKKDCLHLLAAGGKFFTVGGLDIAKETVEQMQFLSDLYEKGEFKAIIDKIYPLESIVDAHRYVDSGHKKGNVVVQV